MGEVVRHADHGRSPAVRVVVAVVFAVFLSGPTAAVAAAAGSGGADPVGTVLSGLGGAPTTSDSPVSPSHFSFTVTTSLLKGPNGVDLNNGAVRNDPGALLFVTPTWDPGEVCGCVYDSHPVGVSYTPQRRSGSSSTRTTRPSNPERATTSSSSRRRQRMRSGGPPPRPASAST